MNSESDAVALLTLIPIHAKLIYTSLGGEQTRERDTQPQVLLDIQIIARPQGIQKLRGILTQGRNSILLATVEVSNWLDTSFQSFSDQDTGVSRRLAAPDYLVS